jgi:hypothetical protein
MLILSGKRLKYITLGVFVMLLIGTITVTLKSDDTEYINTVSLPVSGKVVVVDARASEYQMRERKVVMELQKRKLI